MQLIKEWIKVIHQRVATQLAIYDKNIFRNRSDIGEYENPNRVGPRANCPSCPSLSVTMTVYVHN